MDRSYPKGRQSGRVARIVLEAKADRHTNALRAHPLHTLAAAVAISHKVSMPTAQAHYIEPYLVQH